ncbi:AAA family ATPase [Cyanobium sp. N.Huapi 1H5]|nr:AAA family ATPase [Cyanobium sp. N.Huapi 1H5]
MGAHPDTPGYGWVDGCSPTEASLAQAPAWLLDLIPSKAAPRPAAAPTPPTEPPPAGAVPFRDFLTKDAADLIDTGSRPGNNNTEGCALALELVAVERWLKSQGVTADESARDAFALYIAHSDQPIPRAGGRFEPFDTAKAWGRFDTAEKKDPTPATPEDKLRDRLTYHRRELVQLPTGSIDISQPTRASSNGKVPDEATSCGSKSVPPREERKRKDRKPTNLSLSRRLECFRHCCAALVSTERNSLRRMARLRHAVEALKLKGIVAPKEIGAQVLEAQDRRAGNCFSLLTALERELMPKPVVRWHVPGCIPAGDLTIIGGRPKVGKTRLAVAVARALLRQEDFLGFGVPPTQHPVILVSDDQGDADTNDQLEKLQIWDHPLLLWVRRFRVTEDDLDQLQGAIKAHPGAVVIIDSLRSITRSCPFGENDPEIGALVYDLKTGVMDAGGSLLLIHHCNKTEALVGVEALSGHGSISGAANTVLTLHYLPDQKGHPSKDQPQRRLVREARTGEGVDLVISPLAGRGDFYRVGTFSEWQRSQQQANEEEKDIGRMSQREKDVIRLLTDNGGWMKRREVCDALGVIWGDRGKDPAAKQMGRTLERLKRLNFIESDRPQQETLYRIRSRALMDGSVAPAGPASDSNGFDDPNCVGSVGSVGDEHTKGKAVTPLTQSGGVSESPAAPPLAPLAPLTPLPTTSPPFLPGEDDPWWPARSNC